MRNALLRFWRRLFTYGLWWNLRRWWSIHIERRFRLRDLLGPLLIVIAAFIAYQARTNEKVLWAFILYVVIALVQLLTKLFSRDNHHVFVGRVIGNLLSHLNQSLFRATNLTRFTLFCLAPFNKHFLIPFYRFRRGISNVFREADRSQARFAQDQGVTGKAWLDPPFEFTFQEFPRFKRREVMEAYYIKELSVPAETARHISNNMMEVCAIGSFACLDGWQHLLGILSVDFRNAQVSRQILEDGHKVYVVSPFTDAGDEGKIVIDSDSLHVVLQSVSITLETLRMKNDN